MRMMQLKLDGRVVYDSAFDPKTGNIIRRVEQGDGWRNFNISAKAQSELSAKFPNRYRDIASPSPELIDVAITDKCSFGCSFCYQDSRPRNPHGDKSLIETLLKGFDNVPFQIAIGGGEPMEHPDFIEILHTAKKLGTVPNYTTAGHKMTPEIIAATNATCGGVALTYHAFKGESYFEQTYKTLREGLKVQLNVHLIADKNVAKNLDYLTRMQDKLGKISLVLLAYYPTVGRATMDLMMTRTTYMRDLPESIKWATTNKMQVAFSEGLLPYFNSRPELGISTKLAARSEGIFSCYVDPKGRLRKSSFDQGHEREDEPTIFTTKAQELWEKLYVTTGDPGLGPCHDCKSRTHCSAPSPFHSAVCAYTHPNSLPLLTKNNLRSALDRLTDDED